MNEFIIKLFLNFFLKLKVMMPISVMYPEWIAGIRIIHPWMIIEAIVII